MPLIDAVAEFHSLRRRYFCVGLASTGFANGVIAVTANAQTAAIKAPGPKTIKPEYAIVDPQYAMSFPRDFGAHPNYRSEWWYISGWLDRNGAEPLGVQVTFFRAKSDFNLTTQNAFAPTQLIFAHMAIAVPESQTLLHDQKSARVGFGVAKVAENDTDCELYGWALKRETQGQERYVVKAQCVSQQQKFAFDLQFIPRGQPALQGKKGFSQKGPLVAQASHYYSRPQLGVSGNISLNGKLQNVSGKAWLDHEWSSTLLDPNAVGWDWIGINLFDGGSLLAFQLRSENGQTPVWTYAVLRDANDTVIYESSGPQAVRFEVLKRWRSINSGAEYPVAQKISFGTFRFTLEPAFNQQEIDGRATTGGFYWEGAVKLINDQSEPKAVGRGYLEMTGYAGKIRL